MWAIESADEGGKPGDEPRAEMKSARLKFEGDKFTIVDRGEDIRFTFALDETLNPKVLKLTEVIEGESKLRGTPTAPVGKKAPPPPVREPMKWEWIYKFEGDALIVAFIKGEGGAKPTEFKGKPSKFDPDKPFEPGISVFTLKKTDVPAPPRQTQTTKPKYTTQKK
jgi:uncharacterized protein (TIGR03067 family)